MPTVRFTRSLQQDYDALYTGLEVATSRFLEVDAIIERITAVRSTYQRVTGQTGVPWYMVAAIHHMEAGLRFDRHLHNGDRLTARTQQVPAGRPATGEPPFTWEQSAVDALTLHKLHQVGEWTLTRMLYELEKYNGWGYRLYHTHVYSPYLWSWSNHYSSGKYTADGTWSDVATSKQCGAAVIIRRLEERHAIAPLTATPLPPAPILHFAKEEISRGADLQRFLNTFEGISLRVDGKPGERTSDAMEQIFGFRLNQDPRPPAESEAVA